MRIPEGKRTSPRSPAFTYLDAVDNALRRIDMHQILQAAGIVSASLEVGGVVHAFGSGHSSLLAQEVFFRAGGLVGVNPILDPRLSFKQGVIESTEFERTLEAAQELVQRAGFRNRDAGIVISNSGCNALPVEMALQMKAAGLKVIALTNLEQSQGSPSRHPSHKRLFEIADCLLDNHCPPGDAAVSVSGISHAMGPLSTIIGATILHAMFLEAAEQLTSRGKLPATFVSVNVGEGSLDRLREVIAPYQDRIRYYRPGGK